MSFTEMSEACETPAVTAHDENSTQRTMFSERGKNWWWKYRQMSRELVAEFAGVMILIILGVGVDCQVVLSTNKGVASGQQGDYLSISFGWAVGTALGVWVSAGISGGHINPAVTIMLATWRGFPWKKVPGYIFAQVMGGFIGAALTYANYFHAINIFEDGLRTQATASLFTTYPLEYMTPVSCFFSEFLATTILVIVVLATIDKGNAAPEGGMFPVVLFITILGLGASLGMQTAYALNPARDFGPRAFLAVAGYGKYPFIHKSHYWIWCPIMGPILGAQVGAACYDSFIYNGEDSIMNKPWRRRPGKIITSA